MRRVLALSLLVLCALPAVVRSGALDRVSWLTGCWRGEGRRGALVEERWLPALGNTMLEIGRTVRGDSLTDYELVVIRDVAGGLVYEAHPKGQPEATFPARTVTDTSVVFENLAHDFPQRVGYQRVGADSLSAWIEGTVSGTLRRIAFPYHRVSCESR